MEDDTGDTRRIAAAALHGRPDEYFLLRVRGDSMYPEVLDGDCVLVRKMDSVESGSMAVVLYDEDCATVKWVDCFKDRIVVTFRTAFTPPEPPAGGSRNASLGDPKRFPATIAKYPLFLRGFCVDNNCIVLYHMNGCATHASGCCPDCVGAFMVSAQLFLA